jgi:peroxiredoxin
VTWTTLPEALAAICTMDAPLSERLAAYAQAMRDLGSPFADEYDAMVDRLARGEVGEDAPAVGEPMPPFLLPDASGRAVSLDELCAAGPVVVSFNRGHWCSFCRIELATLAEAHADFVALGAEVVSIMPQLQHFTGAVQGRHFGRLRILTDVDNGYAMSLGLVTWVGDSLRGRMAARGLKLDEFQGNDAWFVPLPATFVVGRDGYVKARFIDPNFRHRMDVADILAALRSA